jgi:hypothetical protein
MPDRFHLLVNLFDGRRLSDFYGTDYRFECSFRVTEQLFERLAGINERLVRLVKPHLTKSTIRRRHQTRNEVAQLRYPCG